MGRILWLVYLCCLVGLAGCPKVETSGCTSDNDCLDTQLCLDNYCQCKEAYAGENCEQCAEGFDRDGDECLRQQLCTNDSCAGHGLCDDSTGAIECTCFVGYTGDTCSECKDGFHLIDEQCEADKMCLENSCSFHGSCEDQTGEIVCQCDTGYAGDICESCDDGYQDKNGDSTCRKDCASSGLNCSPNGYCSDESGEALCLCDEGYSGSLCNDCAAGYHAEAQACVLDTTCTESSCAFRGSCEDNSGVVVCTCDEGYAGSYCDECAPGYHENASQDACTKDPCDPDPCTGEHQICEADGNCGCQDGYQDNDQNLSCLVDCQTAQLSCSEHGNCSDASGQAICDCDLGYIGEACDACAGGYHIEDSLCVADSDCLEASCSHRGTCDDSTGVVVCTCEEGYDGTHCETCDTDNGYHLNAKGDACTNDPCDPNPCIGSYQFCNAQGACECIAGYQDNDGDEECSANCAVAALTCDHHGVCNDEDGSVGCDCDPGYAGDYCEDCSAGFHRELGLCVVDQTCQLDTCAYHGQCDDSTGIVICDCYPGYQGDFCDECASGYQDNDGNETCEPTCATASLSCPTYQTCFDDKGAPRCDSICLVPSNDGATCSSDGNVCFENSCCTPENCTDLDRECGLWPSCGSEIDCGTCGALEVCESGHCFGLEWQDPPSPINKWQDAINYCESLLHDGRDDWRSPSISELRSFIRGCPNTETGGTCAVTDECLDYACRDSSCDGCTGNEGPADGCYWLEGTEAATCWLFWSSSSYANNSAYAWAVNFSGGYVTGGAKDENQMNASVRCVRRGP